MADALLSAADEAEGFRIEREFGYVQLWHRNVQIGLLIDRDGLPNRVAALVARRRHELQRVFESTGWKPS
jgi:hypothetical protein